VSVRNDAGELPVEEKRARDLREARGQEQSGTRRNGEVLVPDGGRTAARRNVARELMEHVVGDLRVEEERRRDL
jgi:hypothetical protein